MIAQAGGNKDNLPTGSKYKKRELAKRNQLAPQLVAELTQVLKFGSQNCADPLSLMQTCAEITNRIDTASKRMENARLQPCVADPEWVATRAKVNRKHAPANGVISGEALEAARIAKPVKEKKKKEDGKTVCKCGSADHQRTTHSSCPLNKKLVQNAQTAKTDAAQTNTSSSLSLPLAISGKGKNKRENTQEDTASAAESPAYSASKRTKSDDAAAATPTATPRTAVALFENTAPAGLITVSPDQLTEIIARAVEKAMGTDQGDERD